MKRFLSKLLEDQAHFGKRYEHFNSRLVDAQFFVSIVKRRKNHVQNPDQLDFDIKQITVPDRFQGKGNATEFFKIVVSAARELGRGVFVENCITPASKKWRKRLIAQGLVVGYKDGVSALSIEAEADGELPGKRERGENEEHERLKQKKVREEEKKQKKARLAHSDCEMSGSDSDAERNESEQNNNAAVEAQL